MEKPFLEEEVLERFLALDYHFRGEARWIVLPGRFYGALSHWALLLYSICGKWTKSSKRSIPIELRQFESRISFMYVHVRRENFVNSVSFWKCKLAKCCINEFSECPAEELKEVSCTKTADVKNFPRKRGLVMNSFIWRTCNLAYLRAREGVLVITAIGLFLRCA